MRTVRLAQVAELNPRSRAALPDDALVSFIPMAGVADNGGEYAEEERAYGQVKKGYTPFQSGDVLFAKITPCMENGKVAHLDGLKHQDGFGSTEFHVLRSGSELDARYLFYFIWRPATRFIAERNMTGSAGQKRVPASFLQDLELPLPPIDEQRRIAAILDKADAIRRKRRQALAETDAFLRAAYLELGGFRNASHASWPLVRIADLAAPHRNAMRTGPFGSDLLHSEFVDTGIAVLGIDNAVQNRFTWGERRFITMEKYESLQRYRVFPRDVIVTIMGTTGRSAVVPDDIPEAITTKHLATITPDQDRVHPIFLSYAVHSDPSVTRQINKANKGAIMAGLNLGIIKEIEIRLPPLKNQKRFADVANRIYFQQDRLVDPAVNGHHLLWSLSQRAFRGEL